MSWLTDIAEHLEDQAVGTVGSTIFVGWLPDSPDAAVAVYDAGGVPSPEGPDVPRAEHRLEVRARAATYALAEALALAVDAQLHGKAEVTANVTTSIVWTRHDAPPARLEQDQRRRITFLGRYTMQTRESIYR